MMTNLEKIYNENEQSVFTEFKTEYEKEKSLTRDLFHTIDKYFQKVDEYDRRFIGEAKISVLSAMKEIEVLQIENKNLSLSEALLLGTKGFSQEDAEYFVKIISTVKGYRKFISFLRIEKGIDQHEIETPNNSKETQLTWTELSDHDFAKLIYAFYNLGILNHGRGGKVNLVNEIATRLDFKLGASWQTSLSRNLSNRKNDAEVAQIFDDLKGAFLKNIPND